MLGLTRFACARNVSVNMFKGNVRFQSAFRSRTPRQGRKFMEEAGSTSQIGMINLSSGQQTLAIASVAGLGGLCLYGLFSGTKTGMTAADKMLTWPAEIRSRVHQTYAYLAGSTAVCTATVLRMFQNPAFLARIASGYNPLIMMAVSMGLGITCQMIPYPRDGILNAKHLAWLAFIGSIGTSLAPICFIYGNVARQAALYTAGIFGGLSMVGYCAPSDKFLMMGGPLAIGFGVVLASSIGTFFASPIGRLGMGLHAVSLYGGLLLFSGFILYDTQKMIARAERYDHHFDPINNSLCIFMDTVNIFVRMLTILSGSNRRK